MKRGPVSYRIKNCGCWEILGPKNVSAFFSHHCDKHDPALATEPEEPPCPPAPPEEPDEVEEVVEQLAELTTVEDVVDGNTGAVVEGDEVEEIETETPDPEPGDFKFE